MMQINQTSKEVKEAIRLAEAKLSTAERQDQRTEREAAEKHRLSSMLYRKAEADRVAQMQLEKRSQSSDFELKLFNGLNTYLQEYVRHLSLSSSPTTTIRLLTGKPVHNDTAPQVNGLLKLMSSDDGLLETTPACSGSLEF